MRLPDSVVDDTYRAAESAIRNGVTITDFLQEARTCWMQELNEQVKRDGDEWNTILSPRPR